LEKLIFSCKWFMERHLGLFAAKRLIFLRWRVGGQGKRHGFGEETSIISDLVMIGLAGEEAPILSG
jgi:hypothetical protein